MSQAIEAWLAAQAEPSDEDQLYTSAYLRRPELVGETSAIAAAAVSTWERWE